MDLLQPQVSGNKVKLRKGTGTVFGRRFGLLFEPQQKHHFLMSKLLTLAYFLAGWSPAVKLPKDAIYLPTSAKPNINSGPYSFKENAI